MYATLWVCDARRHTLDQIVDDAHDSSELHGTKRDATTQREDQKEDDDAAGSGDTSPDAEPEAAHVLRKYYFVTIMIISV